MGLPFFRISEANQRVEELEKHVAALEAYKKQIAESVATLEAENKNLSELSEVNKKAIEYLEADRDKLAVDLKAEKAAHEAAVAKAKADLEAAKVDAEATAAVTIKTVLASSGHPGVTQPAVTQTETKNVLEQYEASKNPIERANLMKQHGQEIRRLAKEREK